MLRKKVLVGLWAAAVLWGTAFAAQQLSLDEALRQLPKIQYGTGQEVRDRLDLAVARAGKDPALRRRLERVFIHVIESDATTAAKDYACRGLQLVGSKKAIPALVSLLSDPHLDTLARTALEAMPYDEVDRALRKALPRLHGPQLAGAIVSIGVREDPLAVWTLKPYLDAKDPLVAAATARALGKIATREAVDALLGHLWSAKGAVQDAVQQGCLEAAERLLRKGRSRLAARIYHTLERAKLSPDRQEAVFVGLLRAEPDQAPTRILKAFQSGSATEQGWAARWLVEGPWHRIPQEILYVFQRLSPQAKVKVLWAIQMRKDGTAYPLVRDTANRGPESVQVAAIEALSAIGTAADVPFLADRLSDSSPAVAQAAWKALVALSGPGVEEQIFAVAKKESGEKAARLIQALQQRGAQAFAGKLVTLLQPDDPEKFQAACAALADLAGQEELHAMLQQLPRPECAPLQDALLSAIRATTARLGVKAGPTLRQTLAQTKATNLYASLLSLLPLCGDSASLQVVEQALKNKESTVRDAAIRTLAAWPKPEALPLLLEQAQKVSEPGLRAVTFRGAIRLIGEVQPPARRWSWIQPLVAKAQTVQEQRLVISALAEIPTLEALKAADRFLSNPQLVQEAGMAIARIARGLGKTHAAQIRPILSHALRVVPKGPARRELVKVKQDLGL